MKDITISDLPKHWKEIVRKEMKEGDGILSMEKALNITFIQFYNLAVNNPDFREFLKEASKSN